MINDDLLVGELFQVRIDQRLKALSWLVPADGCLSRPNEATVPDLVECTLRISALLTEDGNVLTYSLDDLRLSRSERAQRKTSLLRDKYPPQLCRASSDRIGDFGGHSSKPLRVDLETPEFIPVTQALNVSRSSSIHSLVSIVSTERIPKREIVPLYRAQQIVEITPPPWYKNPEESPSSLDQENTVFDALVEALAAAAAAAAKAALQALAEMFR